MKMPLKWAKEFAAFTCTPHEFAERMTMSGSKVETYSCEADAIENVVVGRVEQIEKHPDADSLFVCQINVGEEKAIQIVTSATNLKPGDYVPVARHGSRLPGGKEIHRGKLRGVESDGMMCSIGELGLTLHDFPGQREDGIMVLDEPAPLGAPIAPVLGLDDVSVEFEITPQPARLPFGARPWARGGCHVWRALLRPCAPGEARPRQRGRKAARGN